MNEEIEYAEMLEIPVSTVNMVQKKRRRKHTDEQERANATPPIPKNSLANADSLLRDTVIAQVNGKMETPSDAPITADAQLFAEGANSEGYISFDPEPDRLDTVRLYASDETHTFDGDGQNDEYFNGEDQNDGTGRTFGAQKRPPRALRILLNTELALACALCGAIFFTNVFLPSSAINTFFRSIHNPAEKTVAKRYSEFELAPIVSMRSDAELDLSSTGVLSFTDACCVYPAANGTVAEIAHTDDGLYTVKVSYTDTFTGVFYGLDTVYYAVGEEVKANVPVGYTAGNSAVQITMYDDGTLLNCFELTEENCLAWIDGPEE